MQAQFDDVFASPHLNGCLVCRLSESPSLRASTTLETKEGKLAQQSSNLKGKAQGRLRQKWPPLPTQSRASTNASSADLHSYERGDRETGIRDHPLVRCPPGCPHHMHWEAVSPFPLSIKYAMVVWDLRLETVPIVQWDKARAHGAAE